MAEQEDERIERHNELNRATCHVTIMVKVSIRAVGHILTISIVWPKRYIPIPSITHSGRKQYGRRHKLDLKET